MDDSGKDSNAMAHIQMLVTEEHRLFESKARTDDQERRLKQVQIELDQCWDLLRQRRAARETGRDPADAQLRPPGIVENYEG